MLEILRKNSQKCIIFLANRSAIYNLSFDNHSDWLVKTVSIFFMGVLFDGICGFALDFGSIIFIMFWKLIIEFHCCNRTEHLSWINQTSLLHVAKWQFSVYSIESNVILLLAKIIVAKIAHYSYEIWAPHTIFFRASASVHFLILTPLLTINWIFSNTPKLWKECTDEKNDAHLMKCGAVLPSLAISRPHAFIMLKF